MRHLTTVAIAIVSAVTATTAQEAERRPLDHAAYTRWRAIDDEALSPGGRWVLYRLTPQDGDAELMVRDANGDTEYGVPRGKDAAVTPDERFVVFTIAPELEAARAARRARRSSEEQPQDSLGLLDLSSGQILRIPAVRSFAVPKDAGFAIAYLLHRTPGDSAEPRERRDSAAVEPKRQPRDRGTTLVLRMLASGAERRFEDVKDYVLSDDGAWLAYATATADGEADGVFLVEVSTGVARPLSTGFGAYRSIAFDDEARQVAFLTTRDEPEADPAPYALYAWRRGDDAARRIAAAGTDGVPEGWWVSERGAPRFSPNGRRLFFATMPPPPPEVEDTLLNEERVDVEIWHWQDPLLQPMQQLQLRRERERRYTAVVHLDGDRVVQLATEQMPEVRVGMDGDADVAVGTSELPYRMLISWDYPEYRDVYLVDVRSGAARRVLERTQASPALSPEAQYLAWYDNGPRGWFVQAVDGGTPIDVTAGIPHPLYDEDHDEPDPARPYGSAGWTSGDRDLLVYDRYDLWAVDPLGRNAPRAVTEGVGRDEGMQLRVVDVDRERDDVDPAAPLLLSAFSHLTKDAGFFRDRVNGSRRPERLVYEARRFSVPQKAEDADRLLYTRSDVDEFPDLWVGGLRFENTRKVSAANPQQAEYLWPAVELVEWLSADGVPLQGLLYKPEGFDPSRRYPMVVNFYDRESDNLHAYFAPVPHRSVVRPVFYASRGYLVFMPDVRYRIGYPGESALNAVVPGVLHLVERGYVDAERIGVQGHSWGGYQIAYLLTRTNLFRAAAAGAPVANMVSAYGGLRYESGRSRMFQYERGQSRIGPSLWDAPIRYLENSPIFWIDKIRTPLLIMHNDRDHNVPFTQGVELFTALRRLGKPAWLVNYTGEVHWPQDFVERRDWNIRLQQFFDHYLMDAPAPVWLEEGIPALEKGRTLGLEPVGR